MNFVHDWGRPAALSVGWYASAMQFLGLAMASLLAQGGGQAPPKPASPPSKLVVTDLTVGMGEPVALGDEITVDYTGMLSNGTVFDTSKKPGREPLKFLVGISPVIQGWHQGLLGMRVDGVRKLTIPGNLGYGELGSPPVIPPNATLVFTISLHKVVPLASPQHPIKRLKIDIKKAGDGAALGFGQVGLVKITGKHADGSVFLTTGEDLPFGARFEVGKFLGPVGFTLAVLGMLKGEQRTVVIPPDLAFGDAGRPDLKVKPNETITLELELVSMGGITGPTRSKDKRQ